jgi:hypothetical protein
LISFLDVLVCSSFFGCFCFYVYNPAEGNSGIYGAVIFNCIGIVIWRAVSSEQAERRAKQRQREAYEQLTPDQKRWQAEDEQRDQMRRKLQKRLGGLHYSLVSARNEGNFHRMANLQADIAVTESKLRELGA